MRSSTRRSTSNTNARGNTADRRRRKLWLLRNFGDGVEASCYRCGLILTFDTITVDRIVPGAEDGRYIQSNIRPACHSCNASTGGQLGAARKRAKAEQ